MYCRVHAHGPMEDDHVDEVDGVLKLDRTEKDLVHESFVCDTRDHEDHTFCGVMFNVACETALPAEYIEVASVAVRGDLGPMTVWWTPHSFANKSESEEQWTCVFKAECAACRDVHPTIHHPLLTTYHPPPTTYY